MTNTLYKPLQISKCVHCWQCCLSYAQAQKHGGKIIHLHILLYFNTVKLSQTQIKSFSVYDIINPSYTDEHQQLKAWCKK